MCTCATAHLQLMRATAGPILTICTLGSPRTNGTFSYEQLPRASGVPRPRRECAARHGAARRMGWACCAQAEPRCASKPRPQPGTPRRACSPWPQPCVPLAPQPRRGLPPPRAAAQRGPRLQPARPRGGRCAGTRGAGAAGLQRREARGRDELPDAGRTRAAAGGHGRRAAVALDVEVEAALLANKEGRVRVRVRLISRDQASGGHSQAINVRSGCLALEPESCPSSQQTPRNTLQRTSHDSPRLTVDSCTRHRSPDSDMRHTHVCCQVYGGTKGSGSPRSAGRARTMTVSEMWRMRGTRAASYARSAASLGPCSPIAAASACASSSAMPVPCMPLAQIDLWIDTNAWAFLPCPPRSTHHWQTRPWGKPCRR